MCRGQYDCVRTSLNNNKNNCDSASHHIIVSRVSVPLRTHTREKLRQTYEFALDHVGIDYHSTSIWTDYITFLKNE